MACMVTLTLLVRLNVGFEFIFPNIVEQLLAQNKQLNKQTVVIHTRNNVIAFPKFSFRCALMYFNVLKTVLTGHLTLKGFISFCRN